MKKSLFTLKHEKACIDKGPTTEYVNNYQVEQTSSDKTMSIGRVLLIKK